MVARRQQTTQSSQSVGFYKFVALIFLAITLILFGVIVFMSSKRAIITITTRPEPVDITTTIGVNADSARTIAGSVVTTTVSGTNTYFPTGNKEEPGLAVGTVTIHNETSLDQPLIATTRLLSSDDVLFRIKDRVLVPAGGTVKANVYADQEGSGSDIGPTKFTIPGLHDAKQSVIYATSDTAMSGGIRKIGSVSQDDVEKAKKMLAEELKEDAKASLAAKVDSNLLLSVYDVSDPTYTVGATIGEEVSEFTLSANMTVVGVFFSPDDVQTLASDVLMSRAIDDAEYIEPSDAAPVVTLGSYDLERQEAELDVTYTGRATINPESKQLSKIAFYGKTKDEVRRYLLSLDHVYGVDVHLRPAWTQTIPHVADHVDIVVKQVE
ncbi:MAG: hypothetical protein COU34_02905 [Candidatus Magasanikbacteria bacterium CG10_big_fil_rev_8_21_14_0_10_43_9]|nr:MAG: hypothetical protein COU34_02905 [Candidatus Magasanikbacteria bacterium CG10_big_fil_rev_8_21_14_0_10_43_9]PIY92516.1 MAG: hypothetical protein COY70_02845 [Candidatus Magasanikbacteria bacterium CG_4_10_14_0_8_um_filter_42_12]